MLAFLKQQTIPLLQTGYPVSIALTDCLLVPLPPLVIDYKGQIPSKHVETLSTIGFDRVKVNRQDNILRFESYSIAEARVIRETQPNASTPAPVGSVNLTSFDSWVIALKIISNFLRAHTYPAFTDEDHLVEHLEECIEVTGGKRIGSEISGPSKRVRLENENVQDEDEVMEGEEEAENPIPVSTKKEIKLKKAKPAQINMPWGRSADIPNASGFFFPYVPELATYDKTTVPDLIERFFMKSLGNTPEIQVERLDKLRSAWGVVGQTDTGNMFAHLSKVIHLSLTSQSRVFPIIRESIYQGSVLSGGRFYLGLNGKVMYPLPYEKLQDETGSYHFHSRVLDEIMVIIDEAANSSQKRPTSMRSLRDLFLTVGLSEEARDEIRKLSVHLQFKEKFLAVNAQTLKEILGELVDLANLSKTLPLHHSALFSRDPIFVTLAAFGYQAPSFMIDNCPKLSIKGNVPPTTLVVRQKPLDLATLDWRRMLESKEIRNNPKNLSRANRDRSFVGNDKSVVWGELVNAMSAGGVEADVSGMGNVTIDAHDDDNVDGW